MVYNLKARRKHCAPQQNVFCLCVWKYGTELSLQRWWRAKTLRDFKVQNDKKADGMANQSDTVVADKLEIKGL